MTLEPIKIKGHWLLSDPAHQSDIEPAWFEQSHWLNQGRLLGANSGRGSTWVVKSDWGKWVLRHYYRGGLYAKISKDKYLWTGLSRCRAVREFQLLQHLMDLKLPAPNPIAARITRKGLFYQNDLIMAHLPHERTWAQALSEGTPSESLWQQVGETIAQFHRHGIYHSDLNAHNILLNQDQLYIIDFDKGAILPPQTAWQLKNLNRLKRSIEKVSKQSCDGPLADHWQALVKAWTDGCS